MAAPIVEQIAEAIKARLLKVDANNGYEISVSRVERPERSSQWEAEDRLVRLFQGDEAGPPTVYPGYPSARIERNQLFGIMCYVVPSDFGEPRGPIETKLNLLAASVIKAVATPENEGDEWSQFGGLAELSTFGELLAESPPDGHYDAIIIQLIVTYRTLETDPFTAAA